MMTTTEKIGIKLAGALLLQYGEISTEHIRAIPFLSKPDEAEKVISSVLQLFDTEVYQKMVSSYPTPQWEEIIRLKGACLSSSSLD
jgi:hypothetical protein